MVTEKLLIDANALKKCTCEWCNAHYSDEPCEPSECVAMLRIDGQPTVDAVPVVRCKDCKHWGGVPFGNVCRRWSAPLSGMKNCTKEEDFCSYGERREGE